jgi:uncharacterized protein (DUF433 family)
MDYQVHGWSPDEMCRQYPYLRPAEVHADMAYYFDHSLDQLSKALIRTRIAAGLSQTELAGRLGLKEQQIQRYEARRYAGAGLDRVQAVADALGMQIHERVVLPTGPSGSAEPGGETAPTTTTGSPAARET